MVLIPSLIDSITPIFVCRDCRQMLKITLKTKHTTNHCIECYRLYRKIINEKYYRKNREKHLATKKRYREKNLEKCLARCKQHREKNREKYINYNLFRKSKIKGKLSPNIIRTRLNQFCGCCPYCGIFIDSDMIEKHVDHVLAISNGGKNIDQNVLVTCAKCNLSKNDSLLENWYPNQSFYSPERFERIYDVLNL